MKKIFSPFNQEILDEVKLISSLEAQNIFKSACLGQRNWQTQEKETRIKVVKSFNRYLLNNKDEIGESISKFMGRPIRYSSKEVETAVARSEVVISIFEKLCHHFSIKC